VGVHEQRVTFPAASAYVTLIAFVSVSISVSVSVSFQFLFHTQPVAFPAFHLGLCTIPYFSDACKQSDNSAVDRQLATLKQTAQVQDQVKTPLNKRRLLTPKEM